MHTNVGARAPHTLMYTHEDMCIQKKMLLTSGGAPAAVESENEENRMDGMDFEWQQLTWLGWNLT